MKAAASKRVKISIREIVMFAMLGTIMFCSKFIMEWAPNVHLLGALTITYTIVYRTKALIPIYVYVFLNGIYAGFAMWWIPYLYIWSILWGVTMILPQNMPKKVAMPVYMTVCGLHGLLFGTLYAPAQALMFGLSFKATIAWIIAGLPWDAVHGISNFIVGILIVPLSQALLRAEKSVY